MDKLTGAHEFLDHHTEHELVTVEDQLANIKAKIEHVGPTDHVVADIVRKVPQLIDAYSCNDIFWF